MSERVTHWESSALIYDHLHLLAVPIRGARMKRITIDGVTGVSLWDDSGPLIAFRPDGSDEWRYIPRPKPQAPVDQDEDNA